MNIPQEAISHADPNPYLTEVTRRAYTHGRMAGVAAERDRIRRLAIDYDAYYIATTAGPDVGISEIEQGHFADLIGDDTP